MIAFIWEIVAKKEKLREFEEYYSSAGAWAKLFGKNAGFRGTQLLRDTARPGRYMTIDRWDALENYEKMREQFVSEFEQLDRHCETLTEAETRVGAFEEL